MTVIRTSGDSSRFAIATEETSGEKTADRLFDLGGRVAMVTGGAGLLGREYVPGARVRAW